ncbi:MAG: saccharopine dehydrogenase NADP-binding domain-containing protein [Myxococcota bacterium]
MSSRSDRPYDVVVFGATGFTGGLVADYIAQNYAGDALRWAVAGRSKKKLEGVAEHLEEHSPGATVDLLEVSVEDPTSLRDMAEQTRAVLTTVGPFARYGEPVVRACVEGGADYADITGEPEFVDAMVARYDREARDQGVRIVHCCGFDSIPHDLGALYTVHRLPKDVPLTVEGFVRSRGTFSGGTWRSAVEAMGNYRQYRGSRARPPRVPSDRRVRGIKPRIRYEDALRAWVCPLPTIDPQIVLRSARALPVYGPDFRYGHYVRAKSLRSVAVGVAVVGSVFALSQPKISRDLLLRARRPGQGPSRAEREKAWFDVRFIGKGGGEEITTRVAGGDPGYGETAKMAAESAICLACDDEQTPEAAGVITTAEAMGNRLIDRLQAAGITFEEV